MHLGESHTSGKKAISPAIAVSLSTRTYEWRGNSLIALPQPIVIPLAVVERE